MPRPHWRSALGVVLVAALFASCTETGPTRLSGDGLAPTGSPDNIEAPDGLIVGHRLMANGEYELALDAYNRAVSRRGLDVDTLSALGSANLKLGRLGQARRFLDLAVEKDPEFVPAWNNLGVVLTSQQDFIGAHQAFRAAFALDNGDSEEIWQNLVLALQNLKSEKQETDQAEFLLVRRGNGRFLLLGASESEG